MSTPPAKTAVVLQHTPLDGLGSFQPVLERHGYKITIIEPYLDDVTAHDPVAPDLLVIMGGAISVNDHASYPFITDELRYIEKRLASGKPTFGACLGGQMIAKASSARVYKNSKLEAGYLPVTLTDAGRASPVAELFEHGNGGMTMHWHSDAFDLPKGAVNLAFSDLTPHQAYSIGPNVLGLQFHMEACPRTVGAWLVAYAGDVARSKMDPHALRAEIKRVGQSSSDAGARVVDRWLKGLV